MNFASYFKIGLILALAFGCTSAYGQAQCNSGTTASRKACQAREAERLAKIEAAKQAKADQKARASASQKRQQKQAQTKNMLGALSSLAQGGMAMAKGTQEIQKGNAKAKACETCSGGGTCVAPAPDDCGGMDRASGAFQILGGLAGLATAATMAGNAQEAGENADALDELGSIGSPDFGTSSGGELELKTGSGVGLSTALNEGELGNSLDALENITGLDRGDIFSQLQNGELDGIADSLGITPDQLKEGVNSALAANTTSGLSAGGEVELNEIAQEAVEALGGASQFGLSGGSGGVGGGSGDIADIDLDDFDLKKDKEKEEAGGPEFTLKDIAGDEFESRFGRRDLASNIAGSIFSRVKNKINDYEDTMLGMNIRHENKNIAILEGDLDLPTN